MGASGVTPEVAQARHGPAGETRKGCRGGDASGDVRTSHAKPGWCERIGGRAEGKGLACFVEKYGIK